VLVPNKPIDKIETHDGIALLMIDVVSDYQFEDADELLVHALPMARQLAGLKKDARKAGVPVIYVNDNFGKWQEDFKLSVKTILKSGSPRAVEIVTLLEPASDDYYILKPQRSAFFDTPLYFLLESLKVSRLVITGVTTDICVLFSAHDAYMRGYQVFVPEDCCAAIRTTYHTEALRFARRIAQADTRPAAESRALFQRYG
jgi:nicotinamidase-related amidase